MYQIYQVKAFIIKSKTTKEQDQQVLVFSDLFGLIWINVTSSKKDSSKMRNFLQDFTFTELYLIFGKGGIRLTGGEYIKNFYYSCFKNKDYKISIIKKIYNLIEKFLITEVPQEKIFNLFKDFIFKIEKIEKDNDIKNAEIIFLAKFLYYLGYFEKKYFKDYNYTEKELKNIQKKINNVFKKI